MWKILCYILAQQVVEGYARANCFGLVDERRRISSAIYPFLLFSSVSQSIAHPHPDRSVHFLVMVMVIASEPIATISISVKRISQQKNDAFLSEILIYASNRGKKKKEPDEKIFLEENIFPRGKSGKFSLNIFRGLIAR